eukprot:8256312-Prorocentrum_lima.AAC.1
MAGADHRDPRPPAAGIAASGGAGTAHYGVAPPYPGGDGYGSSAPADPATHNIWDDLYATVPGPSDRP